MPQQIINIGTVPNDPLADTIQQAFGKANINPRCYLPGGSTASGSRARRLCPLVRHGRGGKGFGGGLWQLLR
jgi:hypothetical protein